MILEHRPDQLLQSSTGTAIVVTPILFIFLPFLQCGKAQAIHKSRAGPSRRQKGGFLAVRFDKRYAIGKTVHKKYSF